MLEQALRPVDRGEDEADQRPLLWSERNRSESLACRTKGLYGLVPHNCDGNSETAAAPAAQQAWESRFGPSFKSADELADG